MRYVDSYIHKFILMIAYTEPRFKIIIDETIMYCDINLKFEYHYTVDLRREIVK